MKKREKGLSACYYFIALVNDHKSCLLQLLLLLLLFYRQVKFEAKAAKR